MLQTPVGRALVFVRALVTLVFVAVVVPIALGAAAEWRFGGRQPLHGVPSPVRWQFDDARAALTNELTQRAIADVTVRVCLLVAWAAVFVFVLTVVVETAHMLRHGGHHLPDVRGLGWSQRGARAIASGLLVLLPLAQPIGAVSAGGSRPAAGGVIAATVSVSAPTDGLDLAPVPAEPDAPVTAFTGGYVVRPGDSVYAIAGRLAGGDQAATARIADRIVELNLGREMGDGERFTNAGYLDVGWMLQIPDDAAAVLAGQQDLARPHVVVPGESLWSIADDELGDPHLWPELYEVNAGRRFDDGRVFDDPSVVQPGWELQLPDRGVTETPPEQPAPPPPPPSPSPSPSPGVAIELHDAHHDDQYREPAPTLSHQQDAAPPTTLPVAARSENVWQPDSAGPSVVAPTSATDAADDAADDDAPPELITIRRAAMLATGILTLLAVRRRRRLRAAMPAARLPQSPQAHGAAGAIERSVRAGDLGGRLARVDIAVRAATMSLVESGVGVLAVRCSPEGDVELRATGPAALPPPWSGAADRWTLPAAVAIETLADAARRVAAPSPALVQLGVDEQGGEVYVDLEAIGALEIGGGVEQAEAIVAAIAATLASSVLAETTTLVSVAVPADAFLGHRLHSAASDVAEALQRAHEAVGPVASMELPIVELRARGTAGEQWAPAVVLVGPGVADVRPPTVAAGIALVSASPIHGPSSRLAPDGDRWVLRPSGLEFRPIGLVPDDISAIGELVAVDGPSVGFAPPPAGDDTIYALDDSLDDSLDDRSAEIPIASSPPDRDAVRPAPEWDLMVRLFGPVEVFDRSGGRVSFERSKTTELVAWLATHRQRSTRSNARTALWEQDVRDATFANVVSEARRALARLVAPPDGEEWVGRTLNEQLPLHPRVVTDGDLLEHALATVRATPTAGAVAALRASVESIAGLPFEGTSYLWPDAEGLTSHLVLLATAAAAELAGHCLSAGDVEGVFEATGRGLRVLPGHEELIALRMRAHAQAGDHAGVRQEWNSYERVINADAWSDGEPSPKLVHLRQQLLHPSL